MEPFTTDLLSGFDESSEQAQLAKYSRKRLVQTSEPYPCTLEALDAAEANNHMDFCDYSYVDSRNRVVGIFQYYDVTPDQPVGKGQERVLIPNYETK
ncbi:hypothetical protein D3C78_308690 [compost metagenome]